jgi:hypothetical protein
MLPLLRLLLGSSGEGRQPLLPVTSPAVARPVADESRPPTPEARAVAPRLLSDSDGAVIWAENGWRQPGVVVFVAPVAGMV